MIWLGRIPSWVVRRPISSSIWRRALDFFSCWYHLDHLSAYKAAQHGHDVYKHVGTVAIISEGTVVTAYHAEEESVHPRL